MNLPHCVGMTLLIAVAWLLAPFFIVILPFLILLLWYQGKAGIKEGFGAWMILIGLWCIIPFILLGAPFYIAKDLWQYRNAPDSCCRSGCPGCKWGDPKGYEKRQQEKERRKQEKK